MIDLVPPSAIASAHSETAQTLSLRRVAFDAPWSWLAAGWRDLWATPIVSLGYGAAFSAISLMFAFSLFQLKALPLLLPLLGGFLLLGPLLAVGLYEVSRRLEQGKPVGIHDILLAGRGARVQLGFLGVALLVLYFFWVIIALVLFMFFFNLADFPPIDVFIPTLLFSGYGLGLLVSGAAAGAALAALAFSISAISVPALLDRRVDAVTAMIASVRAVQKNPDAMALWAALIVVLMAAGIATLFVGLIVAFPLIGHATWHAYKAVVAEA